MHYCVLFAVDVGEEKSRSVCSGLVGHVPLEEMQERTAMFMCNLKPAKSVSNYKIKFQQ